MEFKIEHDIPIPPARKGYVKGERNEYPWGEMDVSDSFFVPFDEYELPGLVANRVKAAASRIGKLRRTKYVTRFVESGGVRVWRVK